MVEIVGDGVRTVLLSFRVTVAFNQVVGQAQVINGVAGFWFVIGDLSVPFPGRDRVIG